jgi:hypothetical protein
MDKYYIVLKDRTHIILKPFTTIMVVGPHFRVTLENGEPSSISMLDVACIVNKED